MLRALFVHRGEGWFGLRTGIVASVDGVEGLVRRLDEVVRGSDRHTDISMRAGVDGAGNGQGQDGVPVMLD